MEKNELKTEIDRNTVVNNRFIIQNEIEKGGYGKIYLATDIKGENKYALKVLLLERTSQIEIDNFQHEIEILRKLYKKENSYVLKLYDSGVLLTKNNLTTNYFIVDYAEKGDLHLYLKNSNGGFGEKYAKILFKKILEGIQFCHEKNICHFDIKVANILLDEKYNPIINDFGLSQEIESNGKINQFSGLRGTRYMMCPQMFEEGKTYNGIDADIFSLGVLLYQLVTSGRGFLNVNRNSYQNIKDKKYEKYWENNFRSEELSDEFKKLFIRMVAYEPSERPRIKDILKDSWFEEINNLLKNNKEEYEKLEQKYIQYMKKIEDKIHNQNEDIIEIKPKNEENQEKEAIKGILFDDKEQIFDESMEPKKLKENKKLKYSLKIKGYINPINFMSSLFYKIIQNYDKDEIYLEASKTKLTFQIIFENEDGEEGIMRIKLYESEYNEYILSFNKTKGNIEIFYDNFLKIKEIIKKKIVIN